MKVQEYRYEVNKIHLVKTNNVFIIIGKGYYDDGTNQWPLIYKEDHHIYDGKKYIYRINLMGNTMADPRVFHIALSWRENMKFLFIQKKLWIHNKDNVMWIVNILVAILAIIASLKAAV